MTTVAAAGPGPIGRAGGFRPRSPWHSACASHSARREPAPAYPIELVSWSSGWPVVSARPLYAPNVDSSAERVKRLIDNPNRPLGFVYLPPRPRDNARLYPFDIPTVDRVDRVDRVNPTPPGRASAQAQAQAWARMLDARSVEATYRKNNDLGEFAGPLPVHARS